MPEEYVKDYDSWTEYKKKLDQNGFRGYFREREIWWCALGVNVGSEQDGKNESFERPVLIVKKARFDLALVVPISSKISAQSDRINVRLLGDQSQLLLTQMRIVSQNRLLRRAGYLKKDIFHVVILELIKFLITADRESETPPDGGESRSPKATCT